MSEAAGISGNDEVSAATASTQMERPSSCQNDPTRQGSDREAKHHYDRKRDFLKNVAHGHEIASPAAPAKLSWGYQERVAAAHHALFHDDPTDIEERRARFTEELNKTLQAFGMSREDMHHLVDYSWERPIGEPAKEIGAALLTLTSLCVIAGYDLTACGEADLEKLQRPETIARIRAKRATRHGRGPLPGCVPAAIRNAKDRKV